ncbi:unnamed protein product [Thlaspi arvense]|uniref:Uncharacterized protein n=1 Tax=Thlaspi arvense TaxID=13288 RepID=A0AAU9SWZ3_THLAR|nr:unnamed protein product [Thlaspi arvense]
MSLPEEEIRKLFRVHKTLNQMLKDRGYIVTDSEIEMTEEEFVEKYGENMTREDRVTLKIKRNDESVKLVVIFLKEPKPKVNEVRPYIKRMQSEKVFRAIFVVKESTRYVLDLISQTPKLHLEIFMETELLMNVKDHVFVPDHRALTTEEKKALLEKYTVKENQLPRIRVTDPVAKYYGLRRGEVVKIIRQSETADRYVTYRYVV